MRTIEELDRIAEENENATSKADWWLARSRSMQAETRSTDEPRQDPDVVMLRKALQEMERCEECYRLLGKPTNQSRRQMSRAYSNYLAITNRRPELAQDSERWAKLYKMI